MIPIRSRASLVCAAALVAAPLSGAARAQQAERVLRVGRCAVYGDGFVELGNGLCGRVTVSEQVTVDGRMRVDPGTRTGYSGTWPANGASDAALRSTAPGGMLPGVTNARHLRIENGADPYSR